MVSCFCTFVNENRFVIISNEGNQYPILEERVDEGTNHYHYYLESRWIIKILSKIFFHFVETASLIKMKLYSVVNFLLVIQ